MFLLPNLFPIRLLGDDYPQSTAPFIPHNIPSLKWVGNINKIVPELLAVISVIIGIDIIAVPDKFYLAVLKEIDRYFFLPPR